MGADYLIHGVFALLQLNQVVLLDDAPRLVINDPETRLVVLFRRELYRNRLELEVRALYAIERESLMVLPNVSFLIADNLRVELGYLALAGEQDHAIGQFRDNDEVVLRARYTF
jgi:hypothetical protein